MWFKPKGWDSLAYEDRLWAQQVDKKNLPQRLEECVRYNQPGRILYLLDNYPMLHRRAGRQLRSKAAQTAVQSGSAEALSAILSRNGFDFGVDGWIDVDCIFSLALRTSLPVWQALCRINESTKCWKKKEASLLSYASRSDMSFDIIDFYLDKEGDAFKYRLDLDTLLVRAAAQGDVKHTQRFLDLGADPHYENGLALLRAVQQEQKEVMEFLLLRTRLDLYGDLILASLRQAYKSTSPLIEDLERAVLQATHRAPPPKPAINENYMLIDEHTLSETQALPGMKLTMLFNFATRQQIIIIDKDQPGAAPGVSVQSFDELGDRDVIEARRQKLVELGGTAEAESVVSCFKPRIETAPARKG